MKALRILIIEDELITAMDLRETLEEAGHRVTAIAHDYTTAIKSAQQSPPDLALVDIELANSTANGIGTAKELLRLHRMPIIFLTGNSEADTFAAAKEISPAAYLLKPFRHDELTLQIDLAWYHFQAKEAHTLDASVPRYLYWPVGDGYQKINPDHVLYLQAEGAYAKGFLLGKEHPLLISANLKHLLTYFPAANFHRLSRSVLINLDHVERLEHDYLLLGTHKTPIPLSVASRKELLKRINIVRTKKTPRTDT